MDKKELNNNIVNTNSSLNKDKIATVLRSIAQLFQPFKDVIINVLPSSKKIISFLDLIGSFFSKLVLFIVGFTPKLVIFVRSRMFKAIILVVLLLIVFNTIVSRIMNSSKYKNLLSRSITEATGYHTIIEGRISLNFLLMSLTIYNAAFYSSINKNSDISLNLLSTNHLKIKFSFLSLLLGNLKPTKVEINRAEIRYKTVGKQVGEDKFLNFISKINDDTNLNKLIPNENKSSNKLINSNDISQNAVNKDTSNLIYQNNQYKDNVKKYINLKDVFLPKNPSNEPIFVNVDEKSVLFRIFNSIINKLTFNLTDLNNLYFSNIIFKLVDSNNKTIFLVDNLTGELKRGLTGNNTLTGEARFLSKNIFFNFNSSNYTKKGNKFNLVVSYDSNFNSKDLLVNGFYNQNKDISGRLAISGDVLKSIIAQTTINNDFITSKDSFLKSDFNYSKSLLSLTNLDLILNNVKNTGILTYNFSGNGIVELDLNLELNNIDSLFGNFSNYRKGKNGSTIYIFSEALLEWINNRNSILNPKYFSVNLSIRNTTLNNIPLSSIIMNAFIDSNDNLYISNLQLNDKDFNFSALGKLQLINKSGTFIVNSDGDINSLCQYISSSDNLKQLLYSTADRMDYSLTSKVFLTDDRIVFNDINGNLGNKTIKSTSATLVERSSTLDLLISSKFEVIDFKDIYSIYNFNKNVDRLYYNTNSNITGIPENLKVQLNIYSDNFVFNNLKFNNFQMEGSIISSGILLHSFSFNDGSNIGNVSGSFNFNDKVSPSIIGNIDFNNISLQAESLNNIFFNNYNISGKFVANGSINISGDNYYNGINRVNGKISLVKYERLKINKENKAQGLYLTLMKLNYQDKDYYQIGDLYGNISIYNNKINLSPNIIRYIDGEQSYRGMFTGEVDILNDVINLKCILEDENNTKNKKELIMTGKFNNLEIQ